MTSQARGSLQVEPPGRYSLWEASAWEIVETHSGGMSGAERRQLWLAFG